MSFPDQFAIQIKLLSQAQRIEAWCLVTGLVASVYAALLAGAIYFAVPELNWVIVTSWTGGAIFGASTLIVLGVIGKMSILQWRIAQVGLWVGVLVVSTISFVFPIVLPIALVPVIGGYFALGRRTPLIAVVYVSLPFFALIATVLNLAFGSPISVDIFRQD